MKNTIKKILLEISGISEIVRKLSDIVTQEIQSKPEENQRVIIDLYDYPEIYDELPIDYIVVDYYDKITGYDDERSGYDKDNNYVVILYIQPVLLRGGLKGYDLRSALNHELKHAYQDFMRRSKGYVGVTDSKEVKSFYTRDFLKLMQNNSVNNPIKDILHYYYYVSNLERDAFIENVYDKNPEYEKVIKDIINKDFNQIDRVSSSLHWHDIKKNYDIPMLNKFKSVDEFLDYSERFLKRRAEKILKKINKVKYMRDY